ncbi:conserved hypothetical protein [Lodderomyces elongisporus NRRL YB-4239]|uniref:Membrane insertase YidC/Oxa/ALB C-terminal domain-containing protein n=1 Tax=Lodderomyces elongisporus (strain ATCC 11503 / CBS 2605 / JCM 1781 / NBRC 1676 / NRRL YB-4239) TaxID=379508 RepID=A5H2Q2_LODEL|nr:conserved hypothetical protein [Lodderomyces elongisporus NRRL YB-4239]
MLRLGLPRSAKAVLAIQYRNTIHASRISRLNKPSMGLKATAFMTSLRFNSTANTSNPSTAILPTDAASSSEISDKLVSFSDLADKVPVTSLHSDQLGYLKSIGMGQGWGPTAIIENLLEICHVYTGLPWWGTIAVVTVGIRVVLFPLYVRASANATKMSKVKPQLDQIMKEIKEDDSDSVQNKMKLLEKRKRLLKENGISTMASLAPIVQLPFAYGFFQALRKMANHPVEGFEDQGIWWFENLSAVDPYVGLQAIAAVAVIVVVRMGGETGQHALAANMKKIMTIVPLASILITKSFSAAVVLYFAINSLLSLAQALLFKMPMLRKMLGMPPKSTAAELQQANKNAPQTTVKDMFTNYLEDTKKKSVKKAREVEKKMKVTKQRQNSANDGFIRRRQQ